MVLEQKCQLQTPHNFGSRVPLLSMEIKISPSAIMKNHKIGFCMFPVGPRAKVPITNFPQVWVKGSIIVNRNLNFSLAIMKNYKIGVYTVPGGPRAKCQLLTPTISGQGFHRLSTEIRISHWPLWKITKLGFYTVPVGPRAKVLITYPSQFWVKSSIFVDGNWNFSLAIMKNHKIWFLHCPQWS